MFVDDNARDNCEGCPTVTATSLEHPFASVTVYVCVPAAIWKLPIPEYGGNPPLAETVTVLNSPKHAIGVAFAVATMFEPERITSSLEDGQDPLEIVHLNVVGIPGTRPETLDVGELGDAIDPGPETIDHEPVPTEGEFAANVVEGPQTT
jgi:hypothetical protein